MKKIYSDFTVYLSALIWFLSFPSQGMEQKERIIHKTTTAYEEVLRTVEENPNDTFCLLSDWDCTIVGISNIDHPKLLRQENTASIIETFKKKGIPVAVVTARWWHRHGFEAYEGHAENMEKTGVCLSDQECFKNLTLDLRNDTLQRGIFIKGVCFTGSSKGLVANTLINHPSFPKASHYLFIDDDPKYISQMVEVFKERTEKLTVFHYPDIIETGLRPHIKEHLSFHKPTRSLSFHIRHNDKEDVEKILEKTESLSEIKGNFYPLLVDFIFNKGEDIRPVLK